jgi:DNA-binding response OmpR family regulator
MAATLSVLIVEDHDRLRDVLMQHLLQNGCHTTGAADAEGMHQCLARESYDVVVLDLNLPDEDGLSLARRLRSTHPEIFIIMMTARNSASDRIAGYDSGADVYISKPSSGDELLAAINSWRRRVVDQQKRQPTVQLNVQRCELSGLNTVSLSATETRILKGLCLAPGLKLDYFRLIELLDQEVNAKAKAHLEVYMARLRKKLVQAGFATPAIKAIRNEGYQLVDSISVSQ